MDWRTGDLYTYIQEIAVVDNEAPVLACPDSLEFFVGANYLCKFLYRHTGCNGL
ncbi:MAG: hypothetical protein R2769_17345 [Saprospiraceae bacterium]